MQRRNGLLTAGVIVAGLAAVYLWLTLLAGPWRLASGLLDARTHLNKAEKALTAGSMKAARYETLAAGAAARRARRGFDSAGPLMDLAGAIPKIGRAIDELDHLVAAAELSASAAKGTLEIAETALRGKNKIIESDPADPEAGARIRLDRIEVIAVTIGEIRDTIGKVARELEAIDPKALPKRIQNSVEDGIRRARKTDETLADAQAGFDVLPEILGADEPRTYLIAMQNSAEQRGTGGSILQFRPLDVLDGAPSFPSGKRGNFSVYNVDKNRQIIVSVPIPEDAWYLREIPDARRFGNANWSPDWPLSAQLLLDYAEAAEPNFQKMDGVIAVDPVMLQKLMPGAGRFVTNYGNVISESKSVHFLLNKAYASFPITSIRRSVLKHVVERFYDGMIKPKHPTELVQGMGDSLATKHMQIWMRDPREQAFIERMNWDGGLEEAPGADYLNVVEQNVGGNKLDFFQEQTHTLDVRLDGDDADNEVTVEVTNAIVLPQPRYVLGDSGGRDQITRPMMNVYVPGDADLKSASIEGTRVTLDSGAAAWSSDSTPPERIELGKRVWPVALEIPFGDTQSVSYSYTVPGVVRSDGGRRVYRLVVQHQPKVRPERLVVRLHLPEGATDVRAPGWDRRGDTLVLERIQLRDLDLEVSWQQ
jgi:hypothetical protein